MFKDSKSKDVIADRKRKVFMTYINAFQDAKCPFNLGKKQFKVRNFNLSSSL
jgi:hypothetical protein